MSTHAGPHHPFLPEGRRIGAGTRRRTRELRRQVLTEGLFAAVATSTGLALAVMGETATQRLVALAAGLACGALFGLHAASALRALRPRARARGIVVAPDRLEVRRGELVSVAVDGPATELGLVCVRLSGRWTRTAPDGDGRADRFFFATERVLYEDWKPLTARHTTIAIPERVPFSQEGKGASVAWRVSARAGRRRTDAPIWLGR